MVVLIKEDQLMNFNSNPISLLETMTYINEDSYHPAMVPVVENATIGKNVIYVRGRMELTESMND